MTRRDGADARDPEKAARRKFLGFVGIVQPRLEDYESYAEYEVKNNEYLLAEAERRVTARLSTQQKEQSEKQVRESFLQSVRNAADTDEVIYEAITNPPAVSDAMLSVLQTSDVGLEVLKHLHNNRREATRIAGLPPIQAARELGIIEAQIKFAPKPTPPKRVSSAPEPVAPVTTTTAATIDEDNLPLDEWIRRRNKAQFGR